MKILLEFFVNSGRLVLMGVPFPFSNVVGVANAFSLFLSPTAGTNPSLGLAWVPFTADQLFSCFLLLAGLIQITLPFSFQRFFTCGWS